MAELILIIIAFICSFLLVAWGGLVQLPPPMEPIELGSHDEWMFVIIIILDIFCLTLAMWMYRRNNK